MSEETISLSDIGEEIIYNWACPVCGTHNEEYEEVETEDTLSCLHCYASFQVTE